MIAVLAAVFIAAPFAVTAAIVIPISRRPLTRVSERHGERPVLRATRSYPRRSERLPAAIVEPRVYEITTLPAAAGARDSERSQ